MSRISILIAGLALSGCASPSAWKPAPVDERGKPIALTVRLPDGKSIHCVPEGEYAMLVVWAAEERGFYLFDLRWARMLATRDFDRFLGELGRLSPCEMSWVDTCTVSRSWGMPEAEGNRLRDALRSLTETGMQWSEAPSLACYCESSGLVFPPVD